MSTIGAKSAEAIYKIEKFLGLNENPAGDTKLKLGQSSKCQNWKVTRDWNLMKRPGSKTILDTHSKAPVQGMWYGNVKGSEIGLMASGNVMWLFAKDGEILEYPEMLGELSTENRVNFFAYSNIVYILNGEDYYQYDGISFGRVIGYRPLIATSRTPKGDQSTLLEEVNKLNCYRRLCLSPTGTDSVFTLPEQDLMSIDYVMLNADGSFIDPLTYTTDRYNGTVTFIADEELVSDGTTATYDLSNPRVVTAVATVNDTEFSVYVDKKTNKVTFTNPPADGAEIVITESTEVVEEFATGGTQETFMLTYPNIASVVVRVDGVETDCYFDQPNNKIIFGATIINDSETHKGDGSKKDFYLWKPNITSCTATVNGTATDITFDEVEARATFETAPANNAKILFTLERKESNAPGLKKETFTGDGSKKVFQLENDRIAYVDVKSSKSETPTLSNGSVTFTKAPAKGAEIAITETISSNTAVEYFLGDGSTKTFALANSNVSAVTAKVITVVSPAYNATKQQITFSEAPESGVTITVNERCMATVSVTETRVQTETFTGDGKTGYYTTAFKGYKASATVDGVDVEQIYDEEAGAIIFTDIPEEGAEIHLAETVAPERGINTIEIGYQAVSTYRPDVCRMTSAELFLGAQDNAVILYGNGTNKAVYSSIDYWGQPRADYFPDLNEMAVADENTPITGMIRHYSQLICFKSKSAYVIQFGLVTTATGDQKYAFYITPVNKEIGNAALGQVRLVLNSPFALNGHDLYEWKSNSRYSASLSSDERNAIRISDRIYATLETFDTAKCYCYDDNYAQEYYICYGNEALVYNYPADAWYYYTGLNIHSMCNMDDKLLFGTEDGRICELSEEYLNDDGAPIDCVWESGSLDFGKNYMRKFMSELWVSMKPQAHSKVIVTVQTDRKSEFTEKTIESRLSTFEHMDFEDFSFNTNRKPQVAKLKIKAKKFAFLKIIFRTKDLYTSAVVLSADPKIRETGYVK